MTAATETTAYRHIELFASVCDLDAVERAAYLDKACAGDAAMRATVERMVAADERNREDGFLTLAHDAARTITRRTLPDEGGFPRAGPSLAFPDLPQRHIVEVLLRKRMLPGSFIGLVGFGLFFIKNLFDGTYGGASPGLSSQDPFWPVPAVHAGTVLVWGACAVLLLVRGRAARVWELRAAELAITAASAAFFAVFQWSEWQKSLQGFVALPHDPRGFNLLDLTNDECTLRWFVLILFYGTYAPNTWRRWAALMAAMIGVPLLITAGLCWSAHVPAGGQLLDMTIWLLIAASIAVSGPLGVNMLQRERIEARRVGPYRLGRCLGRGGMGVVFLAEHCRHAGLYAVKLLVPDSAAETARVERFEQEVKTMACLTHLNVARVIDYGRTDDDIVYYSMEYLPGLSLKQLIARHGPLPPGRVVHLLKQACSALGDAHGRGVVHRDIKPGNIMVCERGGVWDVVKVLDFGIARPFAVEAAAGRSRLSGPDYVRHFEGTPAYMSPEQAAGAAPTPASDIYSLGATAYFMLTGEAFRRPGVDATIRAHLAESPVAPMDLQDIVLRCLEKDVARRFPDVGQLEKALANCQCAGSWDNEKAMRWWGELKTRFTGAHEGREEEKRRE